MELKNGYGSVLDGCLYGGFVALSCSPLGFGLCHSKSFHILKFFLMAAGLHRIGRIPIILLTKGYLMAGAITTALEGFATDLTTVASQALTVGAAALLVWIGWRLACKIPNRGAGK